MIRGDDKLRKAGGDLKLLNLSLAHLDLVVLARLEGAFDVFTDEVSAIDSFFPEHAVPPFNLVEYARDKGSNTLQGGRNRSGCAAVNLPSC